MKHTKGHLTSEISQIRQKDKRRSGSGPEDWNTYVNRTYLHFTGRRNCPQPLNNCYIKIAKPNQVAFIPMKVTTLKIMVTDLFQETPMVVITRTAPSKESHIDEEGTSQVLAKLLGLDAVDTSERKQKPNPFSADLAELSYASKLQSDDNTKKTNQGKRRVRRQRCFPPFWQCSAQPTSSSLEQVLPQRGNVNL